ncbi:MAG: nitroreductase family deazaflavin-dependent oxidoreductase [Anaerolineae bacterium]|nr:nitroreductase family deazaflavin-dependent oxidoreductase [Anaerolineae bacterium]
MSANTERLPYPKGLSRYLIRLPIWVYQSGLGRLMSGMRLMVLTTWGRQSGLPRHTAIEYRTHGSKIYVVSAWGRRPNWYRNLIAQPVVRVRLGRQTFSARAQVVEDAGEALRVLYLFRKRAPFIYDPILTYLSDHQSVNSRTLPDVSHKFTIVRLDPSSEVVGPPAVDTNLKWMWLVLGLALILLARIFASRGRAK